MSNGSEGMHEAMQSENFAQLIEQAAALKALQAPSETPTSKHIATIVVASALAIGGWTLNSLNNVQNGLSRIQVSVDTTAKNTEQVQRDIKTLSDQQGDTKAQLAELRQRVQTLEGR